MSVHPPIAEYIRNIHQDRAGKLWMGTNGRGVVHHDGKELHYFSHAEGFGGSQVTGISEDAEGNIWFSTSEGVVRIGQNFSMLLATPFTNYSSVEFFQGQNMWSIYADERGDVWAGGSENLFRYHEGEWKIFELPYSPPNLSDGLLTNITTRCVLRDSQGTLWLGTHGNGLIGLQGESYRQYTEQDGLTDDEVDVIIEDRQGDLWIGTRNGGVSHFDGELFTNYTAADSLGDNEVCELLEDGQGNIWMSSEGYGVYRFDGRTFQNYSFNEGLGVKAVQAIYEDRNGRLWVGGGGGLYRLNGQEFIHVRREGPW